jgi:putative spermidine/putrescine transport system substrate-binding protein
MQGLGRPRRDRQQGDSMTCLLSSRIAGALIAMLVASGALAQGEVGIVSWGGSYQDAQRKAYFEPFTKATGIRVIDGTGPQIERTRAEVMSRNPSFDLVVTNQAFNLIGIEQGLWLPIDYSKFDKADLDAIPAEYRQQYGTGSIVYSEGMALSTQAFPEGKPQPDSYADFWDVAKFPGKRALPWCEVATYPLPEAALLADGVPKDKLYPLDIERAARKLKQLSGNVVWWQDINQAGQLLTSGEAGMAMAPSGRVQVLINSGAPLKVIWNEARYTFDVWYVLKGAANAENAMKFIAFASKPEPQASMARLSGNAPVNPKAYELLDEATARRMPTHPDNFPKMIKKDEAWWKENRTKWVETCKAALL